MKNLPPIAVDGKMRPVVNTEAVDPAAVDDAAIHAIHDYWLGRKGTAFAPRWSDFHLHELPSPALPYVLVLDVTGAPRDFTYRYWGSGHSRYHQRDYTGKRLADLADVWAAKLLTDQYTKVVETRRPWVFLNTYEGVIEPLRSLRMPLSEDAETVTHLISYVGRRDVTEDMKQVFQTAS